MERTSSTRRSLNDDPQGIPLTAIGVRSLGAAEELRRRSRIGEGFRDEDDAGAGWYGAPRDVRQWNGSPRMAGQRRRSRTAARLRNHRQPPLSALFRVGAGLRRG